MDKKGYACCTGVLQELYKAMPGSTYAEIAKCGIDPMSQVRRFAPHASGGFPIAAGSAYFFIERSSMRKSTRYLICTAIGLAPIIGWMIQGYGIHELRGRIQYGVWAVWVLTYLTMYFVERRKEKRAVEQAKEGELK